MAKDKEVSATEQVKAKESATHEKSVAKFSEQNGNFITNTEADDIFNQGVFDQEGISVTSTMASVKEFWDLHKDQPIEFIASEISTEPDGKNGPYDVLMGVAQIKSTGERLSLSIPQSMIVSTVKRTGLGAYVITYKGMQRGRENDYAKFDVELKRLFKNN